jgi:hypothetical protein
MNNKKMMSLQIIVPATYIIMIIVNVVANVLPINGRGTGDISDSYVNLFAPAGITFAIWGVIYILLAVFSIYFVLKIKKADEEMKLFLRKIGVLFTISSVANSIWIFAWHYDVIWLSLMLMIVILICLIIINLIMRNFKYSIKERLLIRVPFNVYFGWITVATIANVTTFLVWSNWDRFSLSEIFWTNTILLVGAVIAFAAILFYKSYSYGVVIIWAYAGILLKHISEDGFNGEYLSAIISVIISIIIIILGEVLLFKRRTRDNVKVDGTAV